MRFRKQYIKTKRRAPDSTQRQAVSEMSSKKKQEKERTSKNTETPGKTDKWNTTSTTSKAKESVKLDIGEM